MNTNEHVLVIGAGPAGLSTAAELGSRAVPAIVLERGPQVGAAWAGRYDGLRFNTSRRTSALPGAPFPHAFGQFPSRDQYVDYLRTYAADHGLVVQTGTDVSQIRREDGGWVVGTSAGPRVARHVVLATGLFNQPKVPDWALGATFHGQVLHSSDYSGPAPWAGKSVVVAGAGTSGMEIAYQLATGGARRVVLALRTPPNIVFREVNGIPGDWMAPLMFRLPTGIADRMGAAMQQRTVGDLSGYGLPRPAQGIMTRQKTDGAGPAVVDAEVIGAIRARMIECVPAVTRLDGDDVVLADGHRLSAEAVILATGYRTGLTDLLTDPAALTEQELPVDNAGGEVAPGLRFVGYVYRPGLIGYVGKIAKRAARQIAADEARNRRRTAA